jgi:hypothetical protein
MGRDYSDYIFQKPSKPQDNRPWWLRLFTSLRPTINIKGKVDKKTKETEVNITVGVKGGIEF